MIFRNKNILQIPNPLSCQQSIDEINLSVGSTSDKYTDTYYGHEDVRIALDAIYHGKCCYCERKPESTLQVEHYRPKGSITTVNQLGYYWMGNEWTNLMLACDTCNNKKRSRFPLMNRNHQVNHPVKNGVFDISEVSTFSSHLVLEEPLIINPEIVDPSNYLTINELGHYEPVGTKVYGVTTIDQLGLNRDSYVYRRQKVIDEIIDEIIELTCERYHPTDPINTGQYQRNLNKVFKKIIARTHDHEEYNMLGYCMIEKFEELILSEVEDDFSEEIFQFFIDFLETI